MPRATLHGGTGRGQQRRGNGASPALNLPRRRRHARILRARVSGRAGSLPAAQPTARPPFRPHSPPGLGRARARAHCGEKKMSKFESPSRPLMPTGCGLKAGPYASLPTPAPPCRATPSAAHRGNAGLPACLHTRDTQTHTPAAAQLTAAPPGCTAAARRRRPPPPRAACAGRAAARPSRKGRRDAAGRPCGSAAAAEPAGRPSRSPLAVRVVAAVGSGLPLALAVAALAVACRVALVSAVRAVASHHAVLRPVPARCASMRACRAVWSPKRGGVGGRGRGSG